MRVLITGALGFTARHLVQRLRREPDHLLIGSDFPACSSAGNGLDEYHAADLTDERQVQALVQRVQPEWVFHLAGRFRGSAPELFRVNLMGTLHLIEALKQVSPEVALLLVGSAAEYGLWPADKMPLDEAHPCRPVGPYGVSKYAMTLTGLDYAVTSRMKIVVARPFNLVGAGLPSSLVVGAILERARAALKMEDPVVAVGNTSALRDFIAVEDVVDAYVALLRAGPWGQVVNICSGEPRSIQSVLDLMMSLAPRKIRLVEDPALFRANDAPLVIGNPEKALRLCGFKASVPIAESLRLAWVTAMEAPLTPS